MNNLKTKHNTNEKINLKQKWEIDLWTKKLGVNKERLEKAIEHSGPIVADVIKWLDHN
jgi:hypothetical protein